jgi:hypothetical protein
MRLVPFEPDHLRGIVPPAMPLEDIEFFRNRYRPCGPAWSGIDGGKVLGCAGIVCVGDTGTVWAILSHPVRTMAVHRAVRETLDRTCRELALRRVKACALLEWDGACRWLERLGFRAVGHDGEYGVYER